MDSDSSSSSEEDYSAIPKGVLQSRTGWDETPEYRAGPSSPKNKDSNAAVNLDQFRNVEVGKGYQARHVVRQASGKSDKVAITDMTRARHSKDKRKREHKEEKRRKRRGTVSVLDRCLQCRGMREFRKEIERMTS